MKLWPPRGGPALPRFVVEFQAASFTTPTESTWLCDAGSPTEAVVLVVKRICREDYSGNAVQPTADVRYRVWLASPEGEKGLELTAQLTLARSKTIWSCNALRKLCLRGSTPCCWRIPT